MKKRASSTAKRAPQPKPLRLEKFLQDKSWSRIPWRELLGDDFCDDLVAQAHVDAMMGLHKVKRGPRKKPAPDR